MRLRSLVVLGVGYVLGTRAGRERYDQLTEAAGKAAQRFAGGATSSGDAEPTIRLSDYVQGSPANGARRH